MRLRHYTRYRSPGGKLPLRQKFVGYIIELLGQFVLLFVPSGSMRKLDPSLARARASCGSSLARPSAPMSGAVSAPSPPTAAAAHPAPRSLQYRTHCGARCRATAAVGKRARWRRMQPSRGPLGQPGTGRLRRWPRKGPNAAARGRLRGRILGWRVVFPACIQPGQLVT